MIQVAFIYAVVGAALAGAIYVREANSRFIAPVAFVLFMVCVGIAGLSLWVQLTGLA